MLIKIKADEHRFTIPLPLSLGFLFTGFTSKMIKKHSNVDIPPKQLKLALKNVKKVWGRSKKLLKGAPLIDVKADDAEVKIFL